MPSTSVRASSAGVTPAEADPSQPSTSRPARTPAPSAAASPAPMLSDLPLRERDAAGHATPSTPAVRRAARLLWPDGRTSSGRVSMAGRQAAMRVDPRTPILWEGKEIKRNHIGFVRDLPTAAGPMGAMVPDLPTPEELNTSVDKHAARVRVLVPSSEARSLPGMPNVYLSAMEAKLLRPAVLESIARTAAGSQSGMPGTDKFVALQTFSRAVRAAASRVASPERLENAAAALEHACLLGFHFAGDRMQVMTTLAPAELPRRFSAVQPGHSAYFAVEMYLPDGGGHSLGIALSRETASTYRVGILDSAGWGRDGHQPVLSKSASGSELVPAFEALLTEERTRDPVAAANGQLLRAWLRDCFSDTKWGRSLRSDGPLLQTPQKHDDCSIENIFLYLAAVLPPSEYKLAKASCLNVLGHIAQDLKRDISGSAITNADIVKLARRSTTALRGFVTAKDD
jgi:hypothetical protein